MRNWNPLDVILPPRPRESVERRARYSLAVLFSVGLIDEKQQSELLIKLAESNK